MKSYQNPIFTSDALCKAEIREKGFGRCAICMSENTPNFNFNENSKGFWSLFTYLFLTSALFLFFGLILYLSLYCSINHLSYSFARYKTLCLLLLFLSYFKSRSSQTTVNSPPSLTSSLPSSLPSFLSPSLPPSLPSLLPSFLPSFLPPLFTYSLPLTLLPFFYHPL